MALAVVIKNCTQADNIPIQFGAGTDAQITYDGTDLVVNPKLVGSGYVKVDGAIKSTDTTEATSETNSSIGTAGGIYAKKKITSESEVKGTKFVVGATQVIGAQGAAVADATGAGDVVAQLNALLARCRAHGLIAT